MYRTFFYTLIFVAVVLIHCGFTWFRARQNKDRPPWSRTTRIFLIALTALCVGAVLGGLAVVFARLEPTVSHALGGIALLMAVWLDFRLSRACGK